MTVRSEGIDCHGNECRCGSATMIDSVTMGLRAAPLAALRSITVGIKQTYHEVSQENGCGLRERGRTAIRRMVPPQSGQMAKSTAVNGRSPLA